jgi:thiol-disulfide isomerase/thioredoxin
MVIFNMKPICMLITDWCPHCKRAFTWMEELVSENPKYLELQVQIIDEEQEPEAAKKFDYYYVPTYYVGDTKVHEGVPSKDIIREVFESAYKS